MTLDRIGFALATGLLLVPISCRAQESPDPRPLRGPSVDSLIAVFEAEIPARIEEEGLPGASIVIVDAEGPVWSAAFGMTAKRGGAAVDDRTIFSVQSMSKTVTATGVLMAVRDGLVDLDEPIVTYLPDFTVHSRFEPHPEGVITLRHLLSHHAGFTHEAPIGNNYDPSYPSFEAYIRSISDTWLRYPVGDRYSYSNLGVDLAGYILERVSGVPFPTYIREVVLEPLGMTRSSFDWGEIRADANRAAGHADGYDRVPLEFGLIPSGAFYSTAEDIGKFIRFHMNGAQVDGRRLLPADLHAQLLAIQFRRERQESGYGLGLGRYVRRGTHFYNHNGGGFGFQSHMAWYPEWGFGLTILTNDDSNGLTGGFAFGLADRLADAALGEMTSGRPSYPDVEPDPTATPDVARLAGHYLVPSGGDIRLEVQDGILALALGGRTAPLAFTDDLEALLAMGPTRFLLRFSVDGTGRPVSMTRVNDATVLDYNGGPADPPGPDRDAWASYEGTYRYSIWGQVHVDTSLERRDGYLYFGDLRMEEHEPGLFFSTTGEALDLRADAPTWRNIRLTKID